MVEPSAKNSYTDAATRGLRAVVGQISAAGEVSNVSFGTPMGQSLQFYKEIPITSMPYGQALGMFALVEWMRWKTSSA
jgi:unsaturated rhamnogalacturonyl hydrolase